MIHTHNPSNVVLILHWNLDTRLRGLHLTYQTRLHLTDQNCILQKFSYASLFGSFFFGAALTIVLFPQLIKGVNRRRVWAAIKAVLGCVIFRYGWPYLCWSLNVFLCMVYNDSSKEQSIAPFLQVSI